MLGLSIGDVRVITCNDENFTTVDNVVEEFAGFMGCQKFLLANSIFHLSIIELS